MRCMQCLNRLEFLKKVDTQKPCDVKLASSRKEKDLNARELTESATTMSKNRTMQQQSTLGSIFKHYSLINMFAVQPKCAVISSLDVSPAWEDLTLETNRSRINLSAASSTNKRLCFTIVQQVEFSKIRHVCLYRAVASKMK